MALKLPPESYTTHTNFKKAAADIVLLFVKGLVCAWTSNLRKTLRKYCFWLCSQSQGWLPCASTFRRRWALQTSSSLYSSFSRQLQAGFLEAPLGRAAVCFPTF